MQYTQQPLAEMEHVCEMIVMMERKVFITYWIHSH